MRTIDKNNNLKNSNSLLTFLHCLNRNSDFECWFWKRVFEETRLEKYVIFGGKFAEFFRILFGKFVWISSKFGFKYEVLL
jgi:hypothetical protein